MRQARPISRPLDDRAFLGIVALIAVAAVTVLPAAGYVWVSGFDDSVSGPAKSLSIASRGATESDPSLGVDVKRYTIASASAGLRWSDLEFRLDGVPLPYAAEAAAGEASYCAGLGGEDCLGEAAAAEQGMRAGDTLTVRAPELRGKTLQVVDVDANAVVLVVTVH